MVPIRKTNIEHEVYDNKRCGVSRHQYRTQMTSQVPLRCTFTISPGTLSPVVRVRVMASSKGAGGMVAGEILCMGNCIVSHIKIFNQLTLAVKPLATTSAKTTQQISVVVNSS